MIDLRVIETRNGGDLNLQGNDLEVVEGFENMVYLAMFGGNVEASRLTERLEGTEDFSWWGNSLMPDDPIIQFNSLTERTLKTTALNSAARLTIQRAVEADLEFMQAFAEVEVVVSLPKIDTVQITVYLLKPNGLQNQQFIFIWNATQQSLTTPQTTYRTPPPRRRLAGFAYTLNSTLGRYANFIRL